MARSLYRPAALALALLVAACAPYSAPPETAQTAQLAQERLEAETALPALPFALDRVGPFVVGARYDSYEAGLLEIGYSSESDGEATGRGCETFSVARYSGLWLMFEDGVLTRIDARRLFDDEPPRSFIATLTAETLSGQDSFAPIGKTVEEAQDAFAGRLELTPHPYLADAGRYLEFFPESKPGYGLIMESENGVIDSLRVGNAPSVRYIEGCL